MLRKTLAALLALLLLTIAVPALAETPPAEVGSFCNEYEWSVLAQVNRERLANGDEPLTLFESLQAAATIRKNELVTFYSHTRPNGQSCFTALGELGVDYNMAGENIAAGYRTPAAVMEGWMNSAGHRANILNAGFTHIGCGYIPKQVDYGTSWVQLFMMRNSCRYTAMALVSGKNGWRLEKGGAIEELGAAVKLTCAEHGATYLPLTAELCADLDTEKTGTQKLTARCHELSASVTLMIGSAPAPTATPKPTPTATSSDGWRKDADGAYRYYVNGSYLTGLKDTTGYQRGNHQGINSYYFAPDGTLRTGFIKLPDGGWRYFGEKGTNPATSGIGAMVKNYYVDAPSQGYRTPGERAQGKTFRYYFNADGSLYTGWTKNGFSYDSSGKWRYFYESGASPTTSRLGRMAKYGLLNLTGNGGEAHSYFFSATGGMFRGENALGSFLALDGDPDPALTLNGALQ